jgi:hypothetical protein
VYFIKSIGTVSTLLKKKNLVNTNQGWETIHQKYKANENTNRYNPKKKKENNQQKLGKDTMQRGVMAMKRQSTITMNT